MQRGSSSSQPNRGYKCPHCHKVFPTTNALGGHANSHKINGKHRNLSPVLAAVLNNPLPGDQEPPASLVSGPRFNPETDSRVRPETNGPLDWPMVNQGHEHLQVVGLQEFSGENQVEPPVDTNTKDLFGEWVLMNPGDERSSEIPVSDPAARAPGRNVDVDLELKIGF